MVCHRCQNEAFKFGINAQGFQRYHCKICGRTFADIQRPLGSMRVDEKRAYAAVQMLCEGVGVRACERLTGLNRRTILGILEVAGRKCEELMDSKVRGVQVKEIQIDEAYAFVGCLEQNLRDRNDYTRGEQYVFLGIDPESKFILHTHIGKRDRFSARDFLEGLKCRLAGR